jgi:pimeloyl-ACP methyl ester carboxylesterase
MATPPFHQRTSEIAAPTLVLHGTHDPIFSPEHGEDMAKRIPNAKLEYLQGAGHNHPQALRPVITGQVIDFLRANSR